VLEHSKKILRAVLATIGLAGALASIAALYATWASDGGAPAVEISVCDPASQPLAGKLAARLATTDCAAENLRLCDVVETARPADETSHGMPAHLIRLSLGIGDRSVPIVGNGRGDQAEAQAFDSLFNNLRLVLKENEICS
jgi:hypothetical protein